MDDQAVVAAQLQRELRAAVKVVARCHLDLPVTVEVPPVLEDGTPFPTRYWLTCPLAVRRIGRLEAAQGVRGAERFIDADPELSRRLAAAHARYAAERDAAIPADAAHLPGGGVGGIRGSGLKCLHAHYADFAAGNDNPAGELARPFVEPLDDEEACVAVVGGRVARNPKWQEPL